jgi:uncharacterized membrane protein YhfC
MNRWIILTILLSLLLTGCTAANPTEAPNIDQGSYLTGHTLDETTAGAWETGFHLLVTTAGEAQGVLLQGTTTGNAIRLVIRDLEGTAVWQGEPCSGVFKYNVLIDTLPAGDYSIWLVWDAPVQGSLDIYIVPGEEVRLGQVPPLALLGGVGMILVAMGFVIYATSRRLGWKYLGLGALGWSVAVFLKFLVAIPINQTIYNALTGALPGIGEWIFHLWVGLLTGIFEVWFIWLVLRRSRIGQADWKQALAFGIGFGAFEALVLGLSTAGSVLLAILSPNLLQPGETAALALSADLRWGLAPVSERFFVVLGHIFANVLLFYSIAVRKSGGMWIAFIYKTLIDTLASYVQLTGINTLGQIWTVEAVIAIWGVCGCLGTRRVGKLYPHPTQSAASAEAAADPCATPEG